MAAAQQNIIPISPISTGLHAALAQHTMLPPSSTPPIMRKAVSTSSITASRIVHPMQNNRISRPLLILVVGLFVIFTTRRRTPYPLPRNCRNAPLSPDVPRPLVVVSAGGQRAGSTVLYNALRILMRIRDPNTISGWYSDLTGTLERYGTPVPSNMTTAGALRSAGTSVLVKVHSVADWKVFQKDRTADVRLVDADKVFTSHRDLRDAAVSLRRMRWAGYVSAYDLKRPDFCVAKVRSRRLSDAEYEMPYTWVRMATAFVICRQRLLFAAGDKLAEDVEMDDLTALDTPAAVKLLARLGHHLEGHTYTPEELAFASRELLAISAPRCESPLNVHPVTHLHRAHMAEGEGGDHIRPPGEKEGIEAIENDEVLSRWLADNGYQRRSLRNIAVTPK